MCIRDSANTVLAREIIKELIPFLGVNNRTCGCERALEHAIVTDRKVIPPRIKKTLTLLIGKYM